MTDMQLQLAFGKFVERPALAFDLLAWQKNRGAEWLACLLLQAKKLDAAFL
jgi:hypothetical protein